MDTGTIEREAVRVASRYIDMCPQLSSEIQTNDKTPLFDGHILVYDSNEHKGNNKHIIGKTIVQVKGHTTVDVSKDSISNNDVTREGHKFYQSDGGCFFFVVGFEGENLDNPRVYYRLLDIPYIHKLLQGSDAESPTFHLDPVPDNKKEFTEIVIGFIDARYAALLTMLDDSVEKAKETPDIINTDPDYLGDVKATINKLLELHKMPARHKEAEEAYQKALKTYKNLADTNPGYQEFVAGLLNNLAVLHKGNNKLKEAEEEYKEALEIRRKLAATNPNAYIGYLASTLYNMGNLYKNLTRYPEAEEEFKEALEIRRKLAAINPDAYNADVAMTLHNLGTLHYDLTRYTEAEEEFKEALEIRRKLAAANPDAYSEDVAMTLNNLAALHDDLTRYTEAEEEYKEALEIYRELAATNPDAYNGYVAMTLNNLGALHYNLTRYPEAEEEYKEALEIRRKLAATNPDAYIADVATTLNNLGGLHYKLTRYPEAEEEYKEALVIRRKLAAANPDAYIGDVAMTLENIAILLHEDSNRKEDAIQSCEEALAIFTTLSSAYPQIWRKYVNKARDLLSSITGNEFAGIEKDITEANPSYYIYKLRVSTLLAKQNPDKYNSEVATTLDKMATIVGDETQYHLIETEYKKTLDFYSKLIEAGYGNYIGTYAKILCNQGILFVKLNRTDEAESKLNESLETYRYLAQYNPIQFNRDVAITLNHLALLHWNLDKKDTALDECEEALKLYESLTPSIPHEFDEDVAKTKYNLAELRLSLDPQSAEAEIEYKDALKLYRRLNALHNNKYKDNIREILVKLGDFNLNLEGKSRKEIKLYYEEKLEIYKELLKYDTNIYRIKLAQTYQLLASSLSDTEQAKAIEQSENALFYYNKDAELNSNTSTRGDIANIHRELAKLLAKDEERKDEAVEECKAALEIYSALASENPEKWTTEAEETQKLLTELTTKSCWILELIKSFFKK